jgi:hypothetical protein
LFFRRKREYKEAFQKSIPREHLRGAFHGNIFPGAIFKASISREYFHELFNVITSREISSERFQGHWRI